MAKIGDTLRLGGDTLVFRRTSADTGGEFVEVEVDYAPARFHPPVHFHPRQQENMRILSGALTVNMDGREQHYKEGDDFIIPRGTPHSLWNAGPDHTRVLWRTTPAFQTERVFETLWGLTNEGRVTPKGPILQHALLTLAFRNDYRVVTGRNPQLELVMCALMAPLGLACGYRPYYRPKSENVSHSTV